MREFLKKFKPYFVGTILMIETVILTGIYYFFWRIGYSHGLPGYPEYLGKGKYILMMVYLILIALLMFYTGAYKFGRMRVLNIVMKQWGLLLAVNLVTYLQLSLTAGQPVAKRPMFDATWVQIIIIVVIASLADVAIKRYHVFGKMIVIGDGIEVGSSVDGYRVFTVHSEKTNIRELTPLLNEIDEYDAVLVNREDELLDQIIEHGLTKKLPVYISREKPMVYGITRIHDNGQNYVLIMGKEGNENRIFDRIRAYLM